MNAPQKDHSKDQLKKDSTPNDPLVLHVDSIEFDPEIHFERRKLTVDVEFTQEQQKQLVENIYARQQSSMPKTLRVRLIGRPV